MPNALHAASNTPRGLFAVSLRRISRIVVIGSLIGLPLGMTSSAHAQGIATEAEGQAAIALGEVVVPALGRSFSEALDRLLFGKEDSTVLRGAEARAAVRGMLSRSVGGRLVVVEIREREPGLLSLVRQLAELNPSWQNVLFQSVAQHCPSGRATVYAGNGDYQFQCR